MVYGFLMLVNILEYKSTVQQQSEGHGKPWTRTCQKVKERLKKRKQAQAFNCNKKSNDNNIQSVTYLKT